MTIPGPQLPTNASLSGNELYSSSGIGRNWYKKVRQLRCDPTISLLRSLFIAPIISSGFVIVTEEDGVPDEITEFIENELEKIRTKTLRQAGLGCLDFGWAPFEKVFHLHRGLWRIMRLKPLLQERTHILVDPSTGDFVGLKQGESVCDLDSAMLFNFDVEGTNWYGSAPLLATEKCFDQYCQVVESAERYDTKIAGSHWVVQAPCGHTRVNGEVISNFELGQRIVQQFQSSGSVVVEKPKPDLNKVFDSMKAEVDSSESWDIELISSNGSASNAFNDRCKYMDTLKARALGFPERAILEGNFGTKAEAGKHGDFALTNLEFRHFELLCTFNTQLIPQLIELNWGPQYKDLVRVEPKPLKDFEKECSIRIFERLLNDQSFLLETVDSIDREALRDRVGLPKDTTDELMRIQ